jgi:hypothetical protein
MMLNKMFLKRVMKIIFLYYSAGVIPGNTWQYLTITGNTWQYLAILGNTWQYFAIPGNT